MRKDFVRISWGQNSCLLGESPLSARRRRLGQQCSAWPAGRERCVAMYNETGLWAGRRARDAVPSPHSVARPGGLTSLSESPPSRALLLPAFPLLPLRPPRPELSPVVLSGPQPARPALTPQGWDWSPSVLTTLLGGRRRNAWDSPVRPAPRPQACLPWKQALPAVPSLASLCSVSVGTALRALGPVASSCGRSQT